MDKNQLNLIEKCVCAAYDLHNCFSKSDANRLQFLLFTKLDDNRLIFYVRRTLPVGYGVQHYNQVIKNHFQLTRHGGTSRAKALLQIGAWHMMLI